MEKEDVGVQDRRSRQRRGVMAGLRGGLDKD